MYTSSPDCAMAGKSSSSGEVVSCSGVPVCATSTLPARKLLLAPNGTSCVEKVKFPCCVCTVNPTGPLTCAMVMMRPFSSIGPAVALGGGGEGRVDTFQLEVPVMESAALKRHPARLVMVLPD